MTSRRSKKRKSNLESKNDNHNNNNEDDLSLLREWATHTDSSFHHFTNEEASLIRSALLSWYRKNRRKLPWRGDPPPYDGSTAGIASQSKNHPNKTKQTNKENGQQTDISSYFTSTKRKTKVKKEEEKQEVVHQVPVSAYGIWVSEIMLQQTRVEAVIPYYLKWMKSFPTVFDLAKASEEDVNSHWAGLGFYRRARMLHEGSKYVVEEMNGILPETVDELMKIKGIGRYTASAIASIAFHQPVPVVDGNVCRVLSRLKGIANHIKAPIFKDKFGWELAQQIIDGYNDDGEDHNAGEINQALMELGATYCAPSGTGIDENDPLKSFYMSTKIGKSLFHLHNSTSMDDILGSLTNNTVDEKKSDSFCPLCKPDDIATIMYQIQDELMQSSASSKELQSVNEMVAATYGHQALPMAPPKKAKREEILVVAAIQYHDKWLMVKRPKDGLLAGQWEFPSTCIWNSNDNKKTNPKKKQSVIDVPIMKPKTRTKSLNQDLCDNYLSFNNEMEKCEFIDTQRALINENNALEHIFSHVRHSIWIEYLDMSNCKSYNPNESYWKNETTNGRQVRWMSEYDMKKVGITSGVRKILTTVKKTTQSSNNTIKKIKKESL